MKNQCKLIYDNDTLVYANDDAIKIFGLNLMKYYSKHYNELFSEESSKIIGGVSDGNISYNKLSTIDKVIYNAEIFRKDSTIIIYFKDVPENLNPIRDNSEASPFENMVIPYLKKLYVLTGNIATAKNTKIINSIKNLTFDMATTMCKYLRNVSEKNLKNADVSFVYTNLWQFMSEIKNDIMSIKNAELENEIFSCFYTYINKVGLTEAILTIIKSYTLKGERAYIRCKPMDDYAAIRIANHKSGDYKEAVEKNDESSNILSILRINEMLNQNKIKFIRKTYSDNLNEYILYFTDQKIMRVCEDNDFPFK